MAVKIGQPEIEDNMGLVGGLPGSKPMGLNTNPSRKVTSTPSSAQGFVPVQWLLVSDRTFGWFNFFGRLSKDYEKIV
jgi:hypothetical protein